MLIAIAAMVLLLAGSSTRIITLQTVVEVAAEKNSTLVLPFPVELLRFLERSTPPDAADALARTGWPPLSRPSHDMDAVSGAQDQPPSPGTTPRAGATTPRSRV